MAEKFKLCINEFQKVRQPLEAKSFHDANLPSLLALHLVGMAACGTTGDHKVGIMMCLGL